MKVPVLAKVLPAALAAAGVVLLYFWLTTDSAEGLKMRLPGADNRPADIADANAPVKIVGTLVKSDGVPADLPGAWPRFRGANFDAVSSETTVLSREWPPEGPKVLWSVELGEGYAGAAVLAGRVYVMDYDRENQADSLRCLSFADGRDIWRYSYPVKVKRWHGMSRTVPAVTDKFIVTIGPKCHVTCLDSATGEFRWMLNLVREFGTKVPQWYTAQCPLIDNDRAIIAPAGDDVLMMAVDCESGEILWKTPNPDNWVMTHSSVVPMDFGGRRFYLYCGGSTDRGGLVAVSAENGAVLWQTEEWKVRTNVPTPVVVGPDRIFLSAGYGQYDNGCTMLRLEQADGKIVPRQEFTHPTDVFGSMQQTPVLYDGHIYGVGMDKQLICLDLEGNVIWTSTSGNKFGFGPYLIADGLIYILNDSGVLSLVEASPSGYVQLAQASVLEGIESWGPMAVASGRLIMRNLTQMVCLDIAKE